MERHRTTMPQGEPAAEEARSLSEYFDAVRTVEGPGPEEIEAMVARSAQMPQSGTQGIGKLGVVGKGAATGGLLAVAGIAAFLMLKEPRAAEPQGERRAGNESVRSDGNAAAGQNRQATPIAAETSGIEAREQSLKRSVSVERPPVKGTVPDTISMAVKFPYIPEERPEMKWRSEVPRKPDYTAYTVYNPEPINSAALEYAPTATADGRRIYFVSNREGGAGGHDLWTVTKENPIGLEFGVPVNIGGPINTEKNEGMTAVSPDGRTLYFTACNRPDGLGDCDIYQATLSGTTWENIRNMTAINSPHWDSQPSVSGSGDTLYFVSNRPGALGGAEDGDIYMAVKNDNGEWETPVNLGEPVNTPMREDSPFILPGGSRLYFSSAGHGGYGKLDFFVAERNGDGSWGEPQNLGPVFNTPEDERMLTATANEEVFYFASERPEPLNLGTLDIYMALRSISGNPIEPDSYVGASPAPIKIAPFPNPATDFVSLNIPTDSPLGPEEEAILADRSGNEVMRLSGKELREPIAVSHLPNGLYIVRAGRFTGSFVIRR